MPLEGVYKPTTNPEAAWARDQAELIERSGGTEGTTLNGMPVVLMTSVGAKSGYLRKTPVMRVEHEGQYAAVASRGGAPKHPTWYINLKAHPHVELQDGLAKGDYLAEELTGEARQVWWERAVNAYPPYAEYAEKTDRTIPVLLLTPMG